MKTGVVFEVIRGWATALVVDTEVGHRYVPEGVTVATVVASPKAGEVLPDDYVVKATWSPVGRWFDLNGAVTVQAVIRAEGQYGYDYVASRDDHLVQMGVDPKGKPSGIEPLVT